MPLPKPRAWRPSSVQVYMPATVLDSFLNPPHKVSDCIFAQLTHWLSADLKTESTPFEFGGRPACWECGCMASTGMAAIGRYRVDGLLRVSDILRLSAESAGQFCAVLSDFSSQRLEATLSSFDSRRRQETTSARRSSGCSADPLDLDEASPLPARIGRIRAIGSSHSSPTRP